MRCVLPQVMWPEGPPGHNISCISSLENPPLLWTGGFDGGIMLWKFDSDSFRKWESAEYRFPDADHPMQEAWPVSLMCGHTAPIVALEPCNSIHETSLPILSSLPGYSSLSNLQFTSGQSSSPLSAGNGDHKDNVYNMLSICQEGTLCLWAATTGRCKRRRKLPPWAGSPQVAKSFSKSRQFICVGCVGPAQGQSAAVTAVAERAVASPSSSANESCHGSILVINAASLEVLQTIDHGALDLGSLSAMQFAVDCDLSNGCKVTLADHWGNLVMYKDFLPPNPNSSTQSQKPSAQADPLPRGNRGLVRESSQRSPRHGKIHPHHSSSGSHHEATKAERVKVVSADPTCDSAVSVSFHPQRPLLLLVYDQSWVVRSSLSGRVLADGSNKPSPGGAEETGAICPSSMANGYSDGMFLNSASTPEDSKGTTHTRNVERVLLWHLDGEAVVYSLSESSLTGSHTGASHEQEISFTNSTIVARLPAISFAEVQQRYTFYCQMGSLLIRADSGPPLLDEGCEPDPQVTVWKLPLFASAECSVPAKVSEDAQLDGRPLVAAGVAQENTESSKGTAEGAVLCCQCALGDGWCQPLCNSQSTQEPAEVPTRCKGDVAAHGGMSERDVTTATIFVSGGAFAPASLVRGYASGKIVVIPLTSCAIQPPVTEGGAQFSDGSYASEQPAFILRGHTKPILCLAEHVMPAGATLQASESPLESNIRVLISGSMDCTVCIWDVEEAERGSPGPPLTVLRHHVAPVRHLAVPLQGTHPPWMSCFLSLGDDGLVALVSLETNRVERFMPGHTGAIQGVVWDRSKGYVACLCLVGGDGVLGQTDEDERILVEFGTGFKGVPADPKMHRQHSMQRQSSSSSSGRRDEGLSSRAARGRSQSGAASTTGTPVLHVWDLHSGARDRVLRGVAATSLFAYFDGKARGSSAAVPNAAPGYTLGGEYASPTEEVGSLKAQGALDQLPGSGPGASQPSLWSKASQGIPGQSALGLENFSSKMSTASPTRPPIKGSPQKGSEPLPSLSNGGNVNENQAHQGLHYPQVVWGGHPLPTVATLQFDLLAMLAPELAGISSELSTSTPMAQSRKTSYANLESADGERSREGAHQRSSGELPDASEVRSTSPHPEPLTSAVDHSQVHSWDISDSLRGLEDERLLSPEGQALRMAVAFLHVWGIDAELDAQLVQDMHLKHPIGVGLQAALAGDRGAFTLFLPNEWARLEPWKCCSDFCAARCLAIVALVQRLMLVSPPIRAACASLEAHYLRGIADKIPGAVPPSLEVLACFWNDSTEYLRSAARSLFHCAAAQAFPRALRCSSFPSPQLPAPSSPLMASQEEVANLPSFTSPISPFASSVTSMWPLSRSRSRRNSLSDDASPKLLDSVHKAFEGVPLLGTGLRKDGKPHAILVPARPDWGGWEPSEVGRWLDATESQDWVLEVGGGLQDIKTARIIVAAALAVWYPTLGRPELSSAVAPPLLSLVRAASSRHSATAAEILAEGMTTTWQPLIRAQIPRLIADVFLICEGLSGSTPGGLTSAGTPKTAPHAVGHLHSAGSAVASAESGTHVTAGSSVLPPAIAMVVREGLTGALLPSLAMADPGTFLMAVGNQMANSPADSPVHLTALMALIRAIRGDPRSMLPHLIPMVELVLKMMEPSNAALRRTCLQTAMAVVVEVARSFPMADFHGGQDPRLAVGEALGDLGQLAIHVYGLRSAAKLRVLDASGPPGHPGLMGNGHFHSKGGHEPKMLGSLGGISAIAFSPDGEWLVGFSHRGMVIKWWPLGSVWWEKLSRGALPVQCSKMVLVQPLSGLPPAAFTSFAGDAITTSPTSPVGGFDNDVDTSSRGQTPFAKVLRSLDLSFRLEWLHDKRIILFHLGKEVATFAA